MNCEIIKDLLPLYSDGVCSEESAKAVEKHVAECDSCRRELSAMGAALPEKTDDAAVKTITEKTRGKIGLLKASVLHSVCMLAAFLVIVYGVYREASIPIGRYNGVMAFGVVAPATGFLLSLMNWHFVRFYESRRTFSIFTALLTGILTVALWLWCVSHYEMSFMFTDSLDSLTRTLRIYLARGLVFTVVLSAVSAVSSSLYATLLGKE